MCYSSGGSNDDDDEVMNTMCNENNKAPWFDKWSFPFLKKGGLELIKRLHDIGMKKWEEEFMPEEYRMEIIYLIHNKSNMLGLAYNYKVMTIPPTAFKLFSIILNKKRRFSAEKEVELFQIPMRFH